MLSFQLYVQQDSLGALTDGRPLGPAPDPKLFVTYDASMGKGKPGKAGATGQGISNVVHKIKDKPD
jgi:Mn-containing catalase